MRILQISPGIYPDVKAGVQIYTYELSRELIRRGHKVIVATPMWMNFSEKAAIDIPIHPLPLPSILSKPYNGSDVCRKDRAIIWASFCGIINQFNPQVIHIQHLLHMGWQTLAKLQTLNIPYIVSLPDYWFLCPGIQRICRGSSLTCVRTCSAFSLRNIFRFIYACFKSHYRRNRCVSLLNNIPAPLVSLSDRTAEIFQKAGVLSHRIVVQPWGINTKALYSASQKNPNSKYIRFGFLGTLCAPKGLEILIKAFRRLNISPPPQLHIYGDGYNDFVIKLKNLALGAPVWFHGLYDHKDLPTILSDIDVLVVPSVWEETYGLVVQEAFAMRKVVIASAIGGLKERIFHGVNGFLFPTGDIDALAQQMFMVASKYQELSSQLQFNLSVQDIRVDGERFEKLYRWTIEKWNSLSIKHVLAIEWN